MPGIARVGVDTAGGLILGGGQSKYFVNNALAAVVGDAVQAHFPGGIHTNAVMVEGSPNVFINNIPVCREGDLASCGDEATGSSDTFAN